MFLKKESIFFVRGCLARTAEFWDCKASSSIPRKYDGGRFPSFLSQQNPATFGHGNDNDRSPSDAMGQRDFKAA